MGKNEKLVWEQSVRFVSSLIFCRRKIEVSVIGDNYILSN